MKISVLTTSHGLASTLSVPTISHCLANTLWGIVFSCSYIFWYSKQKEQCFIAFSVLVSMFTQYTDSHASKPFFSIPMWLLCSWLNICICSWEGIILLLPFTATQSYHDQLTSDGPIFLYVLCHVIFLCSQPSMIYALGVIVVCIFGFCFFHILHWCTHWQVYCCVDSVNTYA